MGLWDKMAGLLHALPAPPVLAWIPEEGGATFVPGKHYIHVYMARMVLGTGRKLWTHRHPVVYGITELQSLDGQREIAKVVGPDRFHKVDKQHLERVLIQNESLSGLLPYRGQDVTFTVGLCAMQQTQALKTILGLLEGLSKVPSLAGLSAGLAVARPVAQAVEGLLGLGDEVQLELGLRHTLREAGLGEEYPLQEGRLVALAGSKGGPTDPTAVSLGPGGEVLVGGEVLRGVDYVVVQVVAKESRSDWRALPSIRERIKDLERDLSADQETFIASLLAAQQALLVCSDLVDDQQFDAAAAVKERAVLRRKVLLETRRRGTLSAGPPVFDADAWPDRPAVRPRSRIELLRAPLADLDG